MPQKDMEMRAFSLSHKSFWILYDFIPMELISQPDFEGVFQFSVSKLPLLGEKAPITACFLDKISVFLMQMVTLAGGMS